MNATQKAATRSVQDFGRHRSCRFSVVEVEHSTEPWAAMNRPIVRGNARCSPEQFIFQTLMVPFRVVMGHVFGYRTTQRRLPDEDHSI
jgi:hypothetical protein